MSSLNVSSLSTGHNSKIIFLDTGFISRSLRKRLNNYSNLLKFENTFLSQHAVQRALPSIFRRSFGDCDLVSCKHQKPQHSLILSRPHPFRCIYSLYWAYKFSLSSPRTLLFHMRPKPSRQRLSLALSLRSIVLLSSLLFL